MQTSSEAQTCALCGGSLSPCVERPHTSYAERARYRIDRCDGCGAGETMPRPTTDELRACYEGDYDYGAHTLIAPEKRWRAGRLIELAEVRAGRVLDVGCMFGYLLDEAKRRGSETWGVELSTEPGREAAAKGHHITAGTLDDLAAAHPDARFDHIFAQHVLEHIEDPLPFLATARELLTENGKLVLCVPNFGARLRKLAPEAWGWYQVPVHLHHFSEPSLRRLVERAGLVTTTTTTRGGDSLFVAVTALRTLGVEPQRGGKPPGRALQSAFRLVGTVLRGYYSAGDDELVLIARRA
jgi:2-polyprenyl-3-methyl-5-hydroxy-6-metoxy-1,4-benzoquinol methylase